MDGKGVNFFDLGVRFGRHSPLAKDYFSLTSFQTHYGTMKRSRDKFQPTRDGAAPFRQFVYDNYKLANVFSQNQSQYEQEPWRRAPAMTPLNSLH
jgi:hypothetical protein